MAWELEFWNPTRTTLLRTLRSETSIEVDEGFTWQLDPNGNCRQWKTKIRNDQLDVPPRAVVVFRVNGTPRFFGVAVDPPSVNSPDSEDLVALGGRELLRVALLDGRVYAGGVFAMVRDILARLCPGALTYSATLIGNGTGTDAGPSLDTFYKPHASLADALDELAKSAQVNWGVDVQGRVFFGRPAAPPLTVLFDTQDWRRLRVQGRETVTRASVRVISSVGGLIEGAPGWNYVNGKSVPYLPKTVTRTAEHAEHPTYKASVALDAPEGVALVKTVKPPAPASEVVNAAATVDDDLTTFGVLQKTSGFGASWRISAGEGKGQVIGARLTYQLTQAEGGAGIRLTVEQNSVSSANWRDSAIATLDLPAGDSSTTNTVTLLLPPDARHGAFQFFKIELGHKKLNDANTTLRIHDVTFLVVDEDAALNVARGALYVPYSAPAEITLGELRDPSPTVTVLGSPQGDVTGPAALFDYAHLPGRPLTTIVKIGAGGQSETAREVQWMVKS